MFATSLVALAAALPQVLAHGGVLSYSNGGNWYWGWSPYNTPSGQTTIQRPWSSYNPIQGATSATIACNDDGTSGALQLTATATAGSKITAYWNQVWPHAIGPMLTYLAACPGSSCTGVNANSLSWFKIDQAGLLSGTAYTGSWGAGLMITQNSSWTTTIPASVPSGNYLIRFETIALHSSPAQFYPECAQLNIVGGGSVSPSGSELVKFPGAYSDSDPGLDIDVYSNAAETQTCYTIPGPPLYSGAQATVSSLPACGGAGASSSSTAPKSSSSSVSTTSKVSTTASSSSSTAKTSPTGCTAAQYAQCGGTGFSGCTTCASGYTCKASSQYYSQCL